MKKIPIYLILSASFLAFSCTEKELLPISASTGKPEKVDVLQIEPAPGGAIITYRIPENEDILAVKAVYTISSGRKMEATTSFYDNQLQLVGYNDMLSHEAQLYSINRAQEYSDPEPVMFVPLESSLSRAANSMSIVSDFGGASFSWRNEFGENISLEFLAESAGGDLQTVRVLTSTLDSLSYTIRGYEPKPTRFGVILSDNYGNETQLITPDEPIVPIFEQRFDKKIQKIRILTGDMSFSNWEGRNEAMIDDDLATFGHSPNGPNGNIAGASFTLDLGKMAKVSRFLYFQRGDGGRYYKAGNARTFEMYTYIGEPVNGDENPDGDWSKWTKIGTYEIIKPSNSSDATVTDEDLIAAANGHEFAIPLSVGTIRYLRFKLLTVWANWGDGSNYWHPVEVTTFGVYDE
jgi:hypothetical protein